MKHDIEHDEDQIEYDCNSTSYELEVATRPLTRPSDRYSEFHFPCSCNISRTFSISVRLYSQRKPLDGCHDLKSDPRACRCFLDSVTIWCMLYGSTTTVMMTTTRSSTFDCGDMANLSKQAELEDAEGSRRGALNIF